jgi:hypothetical protein
LRVSIEFIIQLWRENFQEPSIYDYPKGEEDARFLHRERPTEQEMGVVAISTCGEYDNFGLGNACRIERNGRDLTIKGHGETNFVDR